MDVELDRATMARPRLVRSPFTFTFTFTVTTGIWNGKHEIRRYPARQ